MAEVSDREEQDGEPEDISPWMYGLALIVGLAIGSVIPLPL